MYGRTINGLYTNSVVNELVQWTHNLEDKLLTNPGRVKTHCSVDPADRAHRRLRLLPAGHTLVSLPLLPLYP